MFVYISMLAAFVALGIPLCSSKLGKWGRAVYCIGAAVVFVVISALRFQVGYDYSMYGARYFDMKYSDYTDISFDRMEKGFLLPLYILSLAFDNYLTVFIYTSLIFYPVIFLFIYKYSEIPWVSVTAFMCLGLFFNSLCFLRQFMAALVITYAIKYVNEKNPVRFWVLCVAASAFHWSALIMVIMYFLLRIKPGYIYLGIMTVGTVVFCIISRSVMFWIIDNFYMYKGYDPDTHIEASIGLSPRYTIMFGIVFIICFIFRKRLIEKNQANSVYINCLMYTVIFEAMGTRHAILSRFAVLVYIPPIIYLLPDLVVVIKDYISEKIEDTKRCKAVKILAASGSAAAMLVCFVILMNNNYSGTVPYQSVIDNPYDELYVEKIIEEDEDWDDEDWDDEDWDDQEQEDESFLDEQILSQLG